MAARRIRFSAISMRKSFVPSMSSRLKCLKKSQYFQIMLLDRNIRNSRADRQDVALAKPLNWITYGLVSEGIMPACIATVLDCIARTAIWLFGIEAIQNFLRSIRQLADGAFWRSSAGIARVNCQVIFTKPCKKWRCQFMRGHRLPGNDAELRWPGIFSPEQQ